MNRHTVLPLATTLLLLTGLWCATAYAQDSAPAEDGYRQPGFYGASEQVGEEVALESEEHSFAWFSMTPSLGYAYFPAGQISAAGLDFDIESRNALVAKLHFDFGGDGMAVEMIPFLAVEAGGSGFSAAAVDLGAGTDGALGGQYYALGGQGNLVYRWKAGNFYPHIGLGGHLAYLMSGDIDYGAEVYGRVPLGFTVYLLDNLGLVVEGALMFGVTGVKQTIDADVIASAMADFAAEIDPMTPPDQADLQVQAQQRAMDEFSKTLNFGFGLAWDISVGIRFP